MFRKYARALATIIASATVLAIIPWNSIASGPSQRYIVSVVDGQISQAKQDLANMGLYPEEEITYVSNALIVTLKPNQVNGLSLSSAVEAIYPDAPVSISQTQIDPDWGLDRLDSGIDTLDKQYAFPETAGAGVRIYVLDTGIKADHTEFSGRVIDGYDVYGEDMAAQDCNGHGTHVAGIAAGETYGVAKDATIVSVRVLDCDGLGYFSKIIQGMNWVAQTHPAEMKGVINLSVGGSAYSLMDQTVDSLFEKNILTVVAAGNYGSDACSFSPSRANSAITVGSIDKDFKRSAFSNYGDCVDLYAPGFYVRSADVSGSSASSQKSGTSQSAPFAAGVAALLLGEGKASTPAQLTLELNSLSLKDVVTETNSTRDDLLQTFSSDVPEEPTPDPEPAPEPAPEPEEPSTEPADPQPEEPSYPAPEPKDLGTVPYAFVSNTGTDSVTVNWGAVSNASHYQIMVGFSGEEMTRHSKRVSNTTIYELKGLLPARDYWLQIVTYDNSEFSLPTDRIQFSTEGVAPGAPREADVFRNILSWREPANKGGSSTIVYVIQKRTNGIWSDTASTYETTYTVSYPDAGTDLYRVVSTSEYGRGESTGTLYVRPKAPQIVEPIEQEPVVEGITIAQKQVGSAFVILGWDAVSGATKYIIQKSEDNGVNWDVAASTEKTEALTIAWLNRPYLFKVIAQMSDGSTSEVGSAEYFGE